MANFGGLGGLQDTRDLNKEDLFEMTLDSAFGDRIRQDDEFCERLWGSLSNVDWYHENGDTAGYSFRAAGDLIAAIRGSGNYMDWYCSSPYGTIDHEVEEVLSQYGWTPKVLEQP